MISLFRHDRDDLIFLLKKEAASKSKVGLFGEREDPRSHVSPPPPPLPYTDPAQRAGECG